MFKPSDGNKKHVYVLNACGKGKSNSKAYETTEGGLFAENILKAFISLGSQADFQELMESVSKSVSSTARIHGKKQNPSIDYTFHAASSDKVYSFFGRLTHAVFIVPTYTQMNSIPGAATSAFNYLVEANKIFPSTCQITFMVSFNRSLPYYLHGGIAIDQTPNQRKAKVLIQEVLKAGRSVAIFVFAHGVPMPSGDERVFFEGENMEEDFITGRWLGKEIGQSNASVVLINDLCYASGIPDRAEIVDPKGGNVFAERAIPPLVDFEVTLKNDGFGHHDGFINTTFLNVDQTPVKLTVEQKGSSWHPQTVKVGITTLENDRYYSTLEDHQLQFPELPSAPPYNPNQVFKFSPVVKESNMIESTNETVVQARDANVIQTLRPLFPALVDSAQASFSVLFVLIFGSGHTMLGTPLLLLLGFLGISACAGVWFYISFIQANYVQTLTPVAMTFVLSLLVPLVCDPDIFQGWLPVENPFVFGFTTLIASLVTLLITVSFNWDWIRKTGKSYILFKGSGPVLCTLVKISAIAVKLHFYGGVDKFQHTAVINSGNHQSFVVYFPFYEKQGVRRCGVPNKNTQKVSQLTENVGFSMFNATHDITCVFSVFQNRVKERTNGNAENIVKWVFDKGAYVLHNEDRENTFFFRMLLNKSDLSAVKEFSEQNLNRASRTFVHDSSNERVELVFPWNEDSSFLHKLSLPFLYCVKMVGTLFSSILWFPATVYGWMVSPARG
jgi:hypothetical protein